MEKAAVMTANVRKVSATRFLHAACVAAVLLLVLLVSNPSSAPAQDDDSHRVLFISSYSYSWETVPNQINGLRDALGSDYDINYEFMDTKNTTYGEGYVEFYDFLKYKLSMREPYDAVVVGDDAALNFAIQYQDDLFAGMPIIFEGVDNIERALDVSDDSRVTGVVEQVDYVRNVEFAQSLLPQAKNLIFIYDNAENGIGIRKQLDNAQHTFDGYNVEYLNSVDYTKSELCDRISSFDSNDIVFCVSMSTGKDGQFFTEEERYDMLNQNANVPLFRLAIAGVGSGKLLGGYVVSHYESGRIAGDMVKEALAKGNAAYIPVDLDTPSEYYVDENVFQEFGLDESKIPADATVLNKEEPFYVTYALQIIISMLVVIIVLLLLVIAVRYRNSKKMTRFNKQLDVKNAELEQKNAELQKANSYKSDFLSNMSHEIRTPMNAIIGMTQLAEDEADNPKTKEYLSEIDESSSYMLALLNDVLDMSRMESGRFKLHMDWCSAIDVVDACVAMVDPVMQAKGVTFTCTGIDALRDVDVYTDAMRTKQVLMNLLNNAYKFTPEGGCVSLIVKNLKREQGRAVDEITVEDSGCGMSAEFLPHVFEPFEQERNIYSDQVSSTGLGLAIVKQIIDAVGGSIKVESQLGKGSAFTFTLPYAYREKKNASAYHPIEPMESLDGLHVLLVDDNDLNRRIARVLLEKKNVAVDEATSGEEAISTYCSAPAKTFDVILMDIRMPGMGGLQATEKIRESGKEDAATIPIVAMTANAFAEDREKSQKAGMNAHLVKPINPSLLYQTIAEVVAASAGGSAGEEDAASTTAEKPKADAPDAVSDPDASSSANC